ncbi:MULTISPECIES: hypothetical protein [unclassified Vibrio]|uniref:hypothetical protein n=1 Tax=unclassified Vibrio TaxID=2614977 RepID=UPI00352CD8A6
MSTATEPLQQTNSGWFNTDSAKEAQLKSADKRSENTRRRKELLSLASDFSLSDLFSENELNVNLKNEQKAEIKIHVLKSALTLLAHEKIKHKNKLVEMCVQNELEEILKQQPEKQINLTSGMSVYEALKAGVLDEDRVSIDDLNLLRGFIS